ncbi:VOC family protein [Halobacillus mangrovi]|uniref:VOC family protein n=1 Tax=Halobacillus mangrovi TaxID=402384 RepID=UPI003D97F12E
MKLAVESQTVISLVRTPSHKPMVFPENGFCVGKYYNFIPTDLDLPYKKLIEESVKGDPIGGEGNTRYFTFYDPDGNPLGCCE